MEVILIIRLGLIRGFGGSVSFAAALSFYLVAVLGGILLRNLAQRWPQFMMYWKKKEEIFLKQPYTANKISPSVIMVISTGCLFVILICEWC